jgi:hypothetical protein
MDVSVSHSDVSSFGRQVQIWAQQVKTIQSSMINKVHSLENKWKDPQYLMFVETAKNTAKNLSANAEILEKMAKSLVSMARLVETTQQEMQKQVRNMKS